MLEIEKSQKLEKSIFATIAYYDYFNYPLTMVEIYYYLIKSIICHSEQSEESRRLRENIAIPWDSSSAYWRAQDDRKKQSTESFSLIDNVTIPRDSSVVPLPQNDNIKPEFFEITKILDESEKLKKTLSHKNGFYFLAGREEIIITRIQRKKLTDQKLRKSKWLLKFVFLLPFVQFIAISGSMGIGNPDKKSDIDLLIMTKHGRIWTARSILTFFALVLGVYRHSDKTDNRLCLNHYITDKSLAINFGNLYKAQEYLNLFPVSGDMNSYRKFINANAEWLEKYIYSNSKDAGNANLYFIRQGKTYSAIKQGAEFLLAGAIGAWLENQFKKIQIYYIEKNPLTNHPHSRIRYTDESLVFHPILVEPKIIAEYEEKMRQFKANMA